DELGDRVLELLAGLGPMRSRRMFGGVGLYRGALLFGLAHRGSLYVRADASMRRGLARSGSTPFRPYRGRLVTPFWAVPAAVMGDKRRLRALVRRALAVSADGSSPTPSRPLRAGLALRPPPAAAPRRPAGRPGSSSSSRPRTRRP